jgi:Amt family ammonium transporter
MVALVKRRFRIDDSLDVFAVHGLGGATGVLLTAIFVDAALGGAGLVEGRTVSGQFVIQLTGLIATLIWSVLLSLILIKLVQILVGLRISAETEQVGIDAKVHGERGYNM